MERVLSGLPKYGSLIPYDGSQWGLQQATQLANLGMHSAFQQAQGGSNSLLGLQQMQNSYTPPPDTLETWFSRLERRANALLDRGEFMDTVEWLRWQTELEEWREKAGNQTPR